MRTSVNQSRHHLSYKANPSHRFLPYLVRCWFVVSIVMNLATMLGLFSVVARFWFAIININHENVGLPLGIAGCELISFLAAIAGLACWAGACSWIKFGEALYKLRWLQAPMTRDCDPPWGGIFPLWELPTYTIAAVIFVLLVLAEIPVAIILLRLVLNSDLYKGSGDDIIVFVVVYFVPLLSAVFTGWLGARYTEYAADEWRRYRVNKYSCCR